MYNDYRRGELQKSSLFKPKMDKELQVIDFSSDYEGISEIHIVGRSAQAHSFGRTRPHKCRRVNASCGFDKPKKVESAIS